MKDREDHKSRHVIALVTTLALLQALTHFGVVYSDSKDYYSLTRFIEGLRNEPPPSNALVARPLLPALASLLDPFLGLPVAYGVFNTLFWLGSALATYSLTKDLVGSEESALYAALLLSTSWPMVLYGAASMTEAAGLFGTLVSLLLVIRLMKSEVGFLKSTLSGLLAGLMTLTREVVLTVLASAIVIVAWRRKWRLVLFIASWLTVIAAYQFYVSYVFGANYLTHYMTAGLEYTRQRGLLHQWFDPIIISKAFLLGHAPLAWLTLLLGFLAERRRGVLLTFYALFIPCFAAFILWPFHDLRIAVMCYHATLPMAGLGLKYLCEELSSKPLLSVASKRLWALIIIVACVMASDYVVFMDWGQLSTPWDIYLFAPSSLNM